MPVCARAPRACGRAAGGHGHVNYATVPSICYTHPEVAYVGLTEDEAKKAGMEVRRVRAALMQIQREAGAGAPPEGWHPG